jgi:hypothetical protein
MSMAVSDNRLTCVSSSKILLPRTVRAVVYAPLCVEEIIMKRSKFLERASSFSGEKYRHFSLDELNVTQTGGLPCMLFQKSLRIFF